MKNDDFQRALADFQAERFRAAAQTLEALSIREPTRAEAKHLLAVCYYRLKRFAEAEPLYVELTTRFPDRPALWKDLGWTQEKLGRSEAAKRAFQQFNQLHSDRRTKRPRRTETPRSAVPRAVANSVAAANSVAQVSSDFWLAPPGQQSAAIAHLIQETQLDRWAMLTAYIGELILYGFAYTAALVVPFVAFALIAGGASNRALEDAVVGCIFLGIFVAPCCFIFAALQFKSRRYTIRDGCVVVRSGLLYRRTEMVELYKVTDLHVLRRPFSWLTGSAEIRLMVGNKKTILRGIARGWNLDKLFMKLRHLVLLLRTSNLPRVIEH